ncbi:MAG: hypothetical protein H6978_00070 [Gammaproteobacteria bacterium]|nr:hypothetical protein [Gammaproteobacteria bacterium]
MDRMMGRDETLILVHQNLDQALALLDELNETLAAAHLQRVIDLLNDHPHQIGVANKPTDGLSNQGSSYPGFWPSLVAASSNVCQTDFAPLKVGRSHVRLASVRSLILSINFRSSRVVTHRRAVVEGCVPRSAIGTVDLRQDRVRVRLPELAA